MANMGKNIFAGILEGLGKAASAYGIGQMEQESKLAIEKEKAKIVDPKQTTDVQNYNFYVQNAEKEGKVPVSFGKFIESKYKLLGGGRGGGGGGFNFGSDGSGGGIPEV